MDPLGRLLLARPDTGDSAWVINVGTNRIIATLQTAWRSDLPNVAPDGAVATVVGRDVQFTVPGQTKPRIIIRDGASEIHEIKLLGDWAFMWTRLSVVVTPRRGAPPLTRAGHALTILNKQNGKWLLARDANLLVDVG